MALEGGLFGNRVLVYDDDALNIINTIRLVDGVELSLNERVYVNYIVTNFKKIGVWSKIRALYGFVGGTAASHKWNWKDMRDLDAAFRLQFFGGITHSNLGIKGNGTTGYANTFFTPSVSGVQGSTHLSVYCNENTSTDFDGAEIGAFNDGLNAIWRIRIKNTLNFSDAYITNSSATDLISPTFIGYRGYFLAKIDGVNLNMYINGINRPDARGLGGGGNGLPQISVNILRQNTVSASNIYSSKRLSLATIGDGLTDIQAIQTSQIVTFAQGILGRR
jgi:hypothetical protein